jgi:hypothetical protein
MIKIPVISAVECIAERILHLLTKIRLGWWRVPITKHLGAEPFRTPGTETRA